MHILITILLVLKCLLAGSFWSVEERRITYYWPGEDNWGNSVANPQVMAKGNPGAESWGKPWVAVNDLRIYPFGTIIHIQGIGFKIVHDYCPIRNTIDVRITKEMLKELKRKKHPLMIYRNVIVIYRPADGLLPGGI